MQAIHKILLPSLLCLSSLPAWSSAPIGLNVDELLAQARAQNPELASMRYEADAISARADTSSALPDPTFRIQLQDFTNKASGAATTLVPSEVGSTYYRVMQPLPFWGKRGLKRDIAEADASQAVGRTRVTWNELAEKIKTNFAQYYLVINSRKLTQEMLDLTRDSRRPWKECRRPKDCQRLGKAAEIGRAHV